MLKKKAMLNKWLCKKSSNPKREKRDVKKKDNDKKRLM